MVWRQLWPRCTLINEVIAFSFGRNLSHSRTFVPASVACSCCRCPVSLVLAVASLSLWIVRRQTRTAPVCVCSRASAWFMLTSLLMRAARRHGSCCMLSHVPTMYQVPCGRAPARGARSVAARAPRVRRSACFSPSLDARTPQSRLASLSLVIPPSSGSSQSVLGRRQGGRPVTARAQGGRFPDGGLPTV